MSLEWSTAQDCFIDIDIFSSSTAAHEDCASLYYLLPVFILVLFPLYILSCLLICAFAAFLTDCMPFYFFGHQTKWLGLEFSSQITCVYTNHWVACAFSLCLACPMHGLSFFQQSRITLCPLSWRHNFPFLFCYSRFEINQRLGKARTYGGWLCSGCKLWSEPVNEFIPISGDFYANQLRAILRSLRAFPLNSNTCSLLVFDAAAFVLPPAFCTNED